MPSVDIAIPCYNYAHLLPQCVESVLSQGLSEIRITIIDNASEDDSVAVARKLAAGDRRVELVRHARNVGAHASFNEAIDRADADYFMILCADDLLAAGMLRAGVEALERHPEATVLLGRSDPPFVGDQPPAPQEARAARLTHRDAFLHNACDDVGCGIAAYTMLVRTSVQKTVGHYDSSIRHYDDMEMALRLAARGSVIELDAPLGLRRLHDTNISAALWQDRLLDLRERQKVFNSFFAKDGETLPEVAQLRSLAMRRLADWAYWSALSHLARGRRAEARELYRFALKTSPRRIPVLPLGHLLRTKGALRRATAVLGEAVGLR